MEETLGQRIKRLRQLRRLTQDQLADVVGTSSKSVGNWEADRNHPRDALPRLEKYFGQTLEEGDQAEVDPVVAALESSRLVGWRRTALRAEYERQLAEQDRVEGAG